MEKNYFVKNLVDFEKVLQKENTSISGNPLVSPVVYVEDLNCFIYDKSKVFYRKVPQLGGSRFLFAMKLLEAINNTYIPIFNRDKELLFTEEEFQNLRRKMGGIKEYNSDDFIISNNLEFEGLDYYLNLIDSNIEEVNKNRTPVINEFIRIMQEIGLTTTIGNNSKGDVELIEAGSTSRGTNLPSKGDTKWDFDFTVRINPDKVWVVKNALESKFVARDHITRTSAYKVRLQDVKIPGMDNLIDLDFSLTPQKEYYLSTEDVIEKQLNNIREQDEGKYRLVIANIMYAKAYLKKCGVYKPSRGILEGDRQFGGIGGVGIENWILQNGGSFIDAAKDFLEYAEGREFIDFQKEYAIMDFGKNHVEVSKGNFPYDNFIMKNMRYKGYELMKESLREYLHSLDLEQEKGKK